MSEAAAPSSRAFAVLAYGIVALAIAFEVSTVWLMLHPQVPADYRAYYIDQSTTCLNQPVSGEYELGTMVSFRSDGLEQAKPLRVCGWEGPAGDGTHAIGTSSRLRFALPDAQEGPLTLHLELVAVAREGHPSQRVDVQANGVALGMITAPTETPTSVDFTIPPEVTSASPETLEISLHFPDAIRMSPNDSNTRLRSIKLQSAGLDVAR